MNSFSSCKKNLSSKEIEDLLLKAIKKVGVKKRK